MSRPARVKDGGKPTCGFLQLPCHQLAGDKNVQDQSKRHRITLLIVGSLTGLLIVAALGVFASCVITSQNCDDDKPLVTPEH